MTRNNVLNVLNAYKKYRTQFKLYDDVFGSYTELFNNYSFIAFNNHLSLIDETNKKQMEIEFEDIQDLNLIVDEEKRIELIESAPDFYTAYMIAKGSLTDNVIKVLNTRKNQKTFKQQLSMIKEAIKSALSYKHSNLSVEQVLNFLYINTQLKEKNAEKLKISDLRAIFSKIDVAIDKIEKKNIF